MFHLTDAEFEEILAKNPGSLMRALGSWTETTEPGDAELKENSRWAFRPHPNLMLELLVEVAEPTHGECALPAWLRLLADRLDRKLNGRDTIVMTVDHRATEDWRAAMARRGTEGTET